MKCVHCNSDAVEGLPCAWCGKGGLVREATGVEANVKRHVRPNKCSKKDVYGRRTGLFRI